MCLVVTADLPVERGGAWGQSCQGRREPQGPRCRGHPGGLYRPSVEPSRPVRRPPRASPVPASPGRSACPMPSGGTSQRTPPVDPARVGHHDPGAAPRRRAPRCRSSARRCRAARRSPIRQSPKSASTGPGRSTQPGQHVQGAASPARRRRISTSHSRPAGSRATPSGLPLPVPAARLRGRRPPTPATRPRSCAPVPPMPATSASPAARPCRPRRGERADGPVYYAGSAGGGRSDPDHTVGAPAPGQLSKPRPSRSRVRSHRLRRPPLRSARASDHRVSSMPGPARTARAGRAAACCAPSPARCARSARRPAGRASPRRRTGWRRRRVRCSRPRRRPGRRARCRRTREKRVQVSMAPPQAWVKRTPSSCGKQLEEVLRPASRKVSGRWS